MDCEVPRWLGRRTKHSLEDVETFLKGVDCEVRNKRVLKTLRESPEGKVQRGQYLLAVDLGGYK